MKLRRLRLERWASVALLALCVFLPVGSRAQNVPLNLLFPLPRIDGHKFVGLEVVVDPDIIVFDDTTRTARFTFFNPTAKPVSVWLTPDCWGEGREQPADPIGAAWHNAYPCAVSWLSGYSQYFRLAPHERRTIPLQLVPYPTLPDGRYTARVMWNTPNRLKMPDDTFAEGSPSMGGPHQSIDIVYQKGPWRPRRARARWIAALPMTGADARVTQVQSTPNALVLDDRRRTATVTLRNPGSTATDVWLTVDCPWFRVHYDSALPRGSQTEEATHQRMPSVAPWITGYPQYLRLGPHERRAITLELILPALSFTVLPGSYYAQLRYVQSPQLRVTAAGDTVFTTPSEAVTIVYHRGGGPFGLSLRELHVVQRLDGTKACVTMQQPGLGIVGRLHAEVQDFRGRPEGGIDAATGREGPPWVLDTTVVVWEVLHHHNSEYYGNGVPYPYTPPAAGIPRLPDPVCFALPDFFPRRHRLVVSAVHMEDTAKQAPVQATVVWDDTRRDSL